MFRKNNLYLAPRPAISANSNENCRRYNFQALANISGNIKFPENSQLYRKLSIQMQTKAGMVHSVSG